MLEDLFCKIGNSWSVYMGGVGSIMLPTVLSLRLCTLCQGCVTKDVDILDYSSVLSTLHKLIQRAVPAHPSINEIAMIAPMCYTIHCHLMRKTVWNTYMSSWKTIPSFRTAQILSIYLTLHLSPQQHDGKK